MIDVPIVSAGSFSFRIEYKSLPNLNSTESPEWRCTPLHYIDVSPKLTVGDLVLPLDSLSIMSIVSKFMGPYPGQWEDRLGGIAQRKYNAVHFTPLTKCGRSNSPFSIANQLAFDENTFANGERDIQKLTENMEKNHGLLPITDVVWNHTADNSPWLEEHPEAGYSVFNSPWLEPALLLDDALLRFSEELEDYQLPTIVKSTEDLSIIVDGIKQHVLKPLKLWQYYVIDTEKNAEAAAIAWENDTTQSVDVELSQILSWPIKEQAAFLKEHYLPKAQIGPRFSRALDLNTAVTFLKGKYGDFENNMRQTATKTMEQILDEINVDFYGEFDEDVAVTAEQIKARLKYLRLDDHGPKLGVICKDSPIIETYFTRLPHTRRTNKYPQAALALVNNGWVWAADAMRDNAGADSKAYLRREVIVWSDCVKLRFGTKPEDNPYLWDHMTRYTHLMAKYFKGFRVDNCHSTPIHVAEYLLDKAREVRPNLAVFAELFTGDEKMDYVFVKRLGISALIREAMQAWNAQELSRLVHMHGGRPIGSFEVDRASKAMPKTPLTVHGSYDPHINRQERQELVHQISPSQVHALFTDCSHDNEMPAQKRDAVDTLPNAALVSMCASATGSVMGYDEIYPRHVNIVSDTREYQSPYSKGNVAIEKSREGIGRVKRLLNEIHTKMGQGGFDETFIDHQGEYITIHRMHPINRRGYFLIAHTAFPGHGTGDGQLAPIRLAGSKAEIIGCWKLEVDATDEAKAKVSSNKYSLTGLPSSLQDLQSINVQIQGSDTVVTINGEFPAGSVALIETWIPANEGVKDLERLLGAQVEPVFSSLSLIDLNFLLYRCHAEELDSSSGAVGSYDIPGYGPLVYAGLQGWWSVLRDVVKNNDLGHPICDHLRAGHWALDYIPKRLFRIAKETNNHALEATAKYFQSCFELIQVVPSFLLPRYFAIVVEIGYDAAWKRVLELMGDDILYGLPFLQSLAMVSVQQAGIVKSASLYPSKHVPSLAAGLPHFSTGWARCWGRDVFISIRGLFLGTFRYLEAKEHILAFAGVMKHGMIPNLLSSGKNPRYNARDAVWYFLQAIQDYTKSVPDGQTILQEKCIRRFTPYDDTYFEFDDPRAYAKESTVEEVIQEALQRHATGLSFREHNAGSALDMQMKSEGFQIEVRVDWDTGMIFGGNQSNCGTWMDKMGESGKAGNKGVPGTPRDGAAIEIIGLLYSTLSWVSCLHADGAYGYSGVKMGNGKPITFEDWASKIKSNFEPCYYIPLDPAEDESYDVDPSIANRRGIYKDCYKSGKPYEDYQLRPNFPIAMTVAPSLFKSSHAIHALELADKVLRGPIGMATLDPSDLKHRPYYNNSEDSTDFETAKGRNYHQGPEWVWPLGYFLRALLKFDLTRRKTKEERIEAFQQITQRLEGCKRAIKESPWAGLTELTNRNGEFCADSVSHCPFSLTGW